MSPLGILFHFFRYDTCQLLYIDFIHPKLYHFTRNFHGLVFFTFFHALFHSFFPKLFRVHQMETIRTDKLQAIQYETFHDQLFVRSVAMETVIGV